MPDKQKKKSTFLERFHTNLAKYSKANRQYIFTFVDIKSESPDRYSNHALRMVEELDGFGVQGKVILVLNDKRKKRLTNHKLEQCQK